MMKDTRLERMMNKRETKLSIYNDTVSEAYDDYDVRTTVSGEFSVYNIKEHKLNYVNDISVSDINLTRFYLKEHYNARELKDIIDELGEKLDDADFTDEVHSLLDKARTSYNLHCKEKAESLYITQTGRPFSPTPPPPPPPPKRVLGEDVSFKWLGKLKEIIKKVIFVEDKEEIKCDLGVD